MNEDTAKAINGIGGGSASGMYIAAYEDGTLAGTLHTEPFRLNDGGRWARVPSALASERWSAADVLGLFAPVTESVTPGRIP